MVFGCSTTLASNGGKADLNTNVCSFSSFDGENVGPQPNFHVINIARPENVSQCIVATFKHLATALRCRFPDPTSTRITTALK